ncbi:hypothetical protein BV898_17013 [Hypsibius exemplaris]|uniref:Uncharacterized protein n=1 Tax=Hypsibius exemplaris TaxID=2072580 RepID=A0A9X6NEJ4_HYPEX|nr:hypothetical protein BV898_17013 [Hypsibius exemplaris]
MVFLGKMAFRRDNIQNYVIAMCLLAPMSHTSPLITANSNADDPVSNSASPVMMGMQKRLFTYPFMQSGQPSAMHRKACPFITLKATTTTTVTPATAEADVMSTSTTEDVSADDSVVEAPKSKIFTVLSSKFRALNGQWRHRLRPLRSDRVLGGPRSFRHKRSLVFMEMGSMRRC